jgi:eukaryotic-like serine/threonine-protein kinase
MRMAFFMSSHARAIDVGHVVGDRYRLVERIGRGAMGEVFIAENLAIRLRVAVKLLKPELYADKTFRERFVQEAQAVAAIDHPNVARFLDLVIGDPTFLVMEYVRGPTLAERLRKGPLDAAQAAAIGARLSWALAAAHASGIVHRDLKPSNVILTPDRERGETPKLIDFGLAKLARAREASGLTRTGQVVGTPKYMAPEQIAGGKNVDARSDVYALGCVLYEMLCGVPPFDGDDDVQVLYRQVHEEPRPVRSRAPQVPEGLAQLVGRLLAKDPAARVQSTEDLARALERSVSARGGPALYESDQRPTNPRRPSRAAAPSRAPAIVAVCTVLAALAFGGGFWYVRRQAATAAASAAGVLVVSEPPGADVEVDGVKLARKTPTWADGLAAGSHSVRVGRAATAPVIETVNLRDGERAVVQVTLPPTSHRIDLRSTPDGAQVYLDGRLVMGETPTFVDVTDDDFHELRVMKSGYQTVVKALTPDDKMTSLELTLPPETAPRGALIVDSKGSGEVWVDGLNTGYTVPTLAIQVPVGRHTVELRDGSGARGPRMTVDVLRGQTVRVLISPPGATQ